MTDLVTGEAVALDVRIARPPTRMLALLLDIAIQVVLWLVVFGVTSGIVGVVDSALQQAIMLSLTVLILIGYPTLMETLWRGRSLGKAAAGLRIVGDDGGPERFRQALFRALTAVLEVWATLGSVALFTSMFSQRGKRLGDMFAGTIAVRERMPVRGGAVPAMPPALASWATGLELSALPDELAMNARQLFSRYQELNPQVRDGMAEQLASAIAQRVSPAPPVGTPAIVYISAVLAERRRRDEARLPSPPPAGAPGKPDEGQPPGLPGDHGEQQHPAGSQPAQQQSAEQPERRGGFAPPS